MFGIWPIGGRSTAIKLQDGGVWVLASTPLDAETKSKLQELGPVKYIVGADSVHHLFLSEYKKAYPSAKLIAPEAAIERHDDKDLVFDGVWGRDPPSTRYGFEDEVSRSIFSGVFLIAHAFSQIEHCDPRHSIACANHMAFHVKSYFSGFLNKDYSKSDISTSKFQFNVGPSSSWLYPRAIWALGRDKEAMRRDAKTVSNWDFDRIIPCHGDVIETNGKVAWNKVYKFFLE
ncbi:LOW QUALITY PROTEIN: hypothetical protein CVT26_010852 [Gymnopilus dilepis]|uniref:DUF4336 domain-containing protein n=1 Tax=Gymnopilus dilepis TaxID=231916 RepID=A0A409W5E4_9AGAR|nr:LOW QUALITY PROTEIN: hypothetical protein CVT26_010852 [Gymnopilus dilepis]